jgi:hypothetical protein
MKIERHIFGEDREDRRLIAFLHIPKTAGTTLDSILAHRYSPNERYKIAMRGITLMVPRFQLLPKRLISPSTLRNFKALLKDRHDLREIHGHFDMSLCKFLPSNAELITVLRDPVERAISHYYHYRSHRWIADAAHPLAMKSTLEEWVTARRLVEMDNGQTRRLAGETALRIGRVTSKTLEKAKANLRKFKAVGLTERFEEFQVLLHRQFNWPYCRYPARNVGNNRLRQAEIHDDTLNAIENFNRFDRELYQFASELFEHAIREIDMDKELALLKTAPDCMEPLRSAPDSAPNSVDCLALLERHVKQ